MEPIEIKISVPHSSYSQWSGYPDNKLQEEVDDIIQQLQYLMKYNLGVPDVEISIHSIPEIRTGIHCHKCTVSISEGDVDTCPYGTEVLGDYSTCACCESCRQKCHNDV